MCSSYIANVSVASVAAAWAKQPAHVHLLLESPQSSQSPDLFSTSSGLQRSRCSLGPKDSNTDRVPITGLLRYNIGRVYELFYLLVYLFLFLFS